MDYAYTYNGSLVFELRTVALGKLAITIVPMPVDTVLAPAHPWNLHRLHFDSSPETLGDNRSAILCPAAQTTSLPCFLLYLSDITSPAGRPQMGHGNVFIIPISSP